MSGYEPITEDAHAAEAPECRVCECRTRHRQDADGTWVCKDCEEPLPSFWKRPSTPPSSPSGTGALRW